MKPNPLDPPFDLSITTFAELTGPYTANAARRSSCVTSNDRCRRIALSLSCCPCRRTPGVRHTRVQRRIAIRAEARGHVSAWKHPSHSEERQEEQDREPHVPHDHEWGDEDAGNQLQAAASEVTHSVAKGRVAIHGGHASPKPMASDVRMTTRGRGTATCSPSMRNGQVSLYPESPARPNCTDTRCS